MWREEESSQSREHGRKRKVAEKALGHRWSTTSRMDRGKTQKTTLLMFLDDAREEDSASRYVYLLVPG